MVTRPSIRRSRGALNIELVVALGVLATAMVPIAFGFLYELKAARQCYRDAVAMQLLDGEAEILAAGEWKAYGAGEHLIPIKAPAAKNVGPGKFVVIRDGERCRVEWRPEKGRAMAREVRR